jgi:acyl carrier protein
MLSETIVALELREFLINNFLFGQADTGLEDKHSLMDRGIIDSTGVLEIVSFIEERFGITVADTELVPENLDSISQLARFVRLKTRPN